MADAKTLLGGVVHELPEDFGDAIRAAPDALATWEDITPLARNEWICWVEYVKKADTRKEHVERVPEQLKEGDRRPCCWVGCMHRTDKALSRTQKWIQKTTKPKKK